MITIALPKGRIARDTFAIFARIFGEEFSFEDRKLITEAHGMRFLSVRNQDIQTYVLRGGADVGVVGLDVLEEHPSRVMRLLDLGIGKCRVCVGIPKDKELNYEIPEIRIATGMPNIARNYFAKHAISVDITHLYGSVELAPLLGIVDAIVDNVETGTTMKQNGLKVADEIMQSSAHLIANKNSFIAKRAEILDLCDKISAVI